MIEENRQAVLLLTSRFSSKKGVFEPLTPTEYGRFALLSIQDLDRSLEWFDKYDDWVIFFSRMVPIVRSLISIPAGIASMNISKFSFFTILGTALWSFLLAWGGRLLGEQWPLIAEFINTYQNIVLVIGVAVVLLFVGTRLFKKN